MTGLVCKFIKKESEMNFHAILTLFLVFFCFNDALTKATNNGCGLATVLLYSG